MGCMSTGPQRQSPSEGDGRSPTPLSWLGRVRLFVPLICAVLLVSTLLEGGEWWRWAAVVGLLLLQVVSLVANHRSE